MQPDTVIGAKSSNVVRVRTQFSMPLICLNADKPVTTAEQAEAAVKLVFPALRLLHAPEWENDGWHVTVVETDNAERFIAEAIRAGAGQPLPAAAGTLGIGRFATDPAVPPEPATTTSAPDTVIGVGVLQLLLEVARAAHDFADNSEERMEEGERVGFQPYWDRLDAALDALDELPDDRPGYTMSGPARAEWALRRPHTQAFAQGAEAMREAVARAVAGFGTSPTPTAYIRALPLPPPPAGKPGGE